MDGAHDVVIIADEIIMASSVASAFWQMQIVGRRVKLTIVFLCYYFLISCFFKYKNTAINIDYISHTWRVVIKLPPSSKPFLFSKVIMVWREILWKLLHLNSVFIEIIAISLSINNGKCSYRNDNKLSRRSFQSPQNITFDFCEWFLFFIFFKPLLDWMLKTPSTSRWKRKCLR